jgi:TolA-binding protein
MKLLAVSVVFGMLLVCGCGESAKNEKVDIQSQKVSEPVDSVVIELYGQDGKSVFDITEEQHKIEYLESAVGVFVHAIDSLEIGSEYGWMYSVNDSMGYVASDKYITHDSDIVKWHFRKF